MATCGSCKWSDTVRQGTSLQSHTICRGAPPSVQAIPVQGVAGPQLQMMTVWPPVNPDVDYCKSYEGKVVPMSKLMAEG